MYRLLVLLILIPVLSLGQKKVTMSGYVSDKSTGENLYSCGIFIKEIGKTVYTNEYGFYSVTLDSGRYVFRIVYTGYKGIEMNVHLQKDTRLNISLVPDVIVTEEVTITTNKAADNTNSTEMGKIDLDIEKVKTLPAFLGEVDVIKTIQLLPGVLSAGEGNSGFYVRGGGPDQNLVLLDEAPVYNASHLFGFFSVFNADAVSGVDLYKGSMPAQYGGRLASVVDVSMKEGNNQKFKVDGGLGLIASRLTVQGPIKKDTSSFIISARRTYIDVLMKPFIKKSSAFYGTGYYFYDLNTKFNYKFSDKDRIFLSGYFGKDVFNFKDAKNDFGVKIPWGNATGTARWNHLFNDRLFMNVTALMSKYDFKFSGDQDQFNFTLQSGILDYSGKVDFHYFPNPRHNVRFGAYYVRHQFTPSSVSAQSGDVNFDLGGIVKLHSHEAAVYIGDDFDITDKLRINVGVRYSLFDQFGPFTRYLKDPTTLKTNDTIVYGKGQSVALYHGAEPRFSMRYTLDKNSSVKAGYTHNLQYMHLASLSTVSLPTDVWIPCTDRVKPQIGNQYSVGYFRNFKNNMFETSVEVYYKNMRNQVEYREGALPDDDIKDNPDNNFVFGKGWSYGSEFFIKKRTGKFNGWIGYTLAWTKRKFPEINFGKTYYAKFDRRHDVSVALVYEPTKRLTFGLIFIYATGNAITLPVSWYLIDNRITYEYAARNSLRMNPYHRLDLSVTLKGKETKKFKSSWNLSVYNVYSRLNPYFLYVDTNGDPYQGTLTVKAKQVSLFPILPSVTWNFSF